MSIGEPKMLTPEEQAEIQKERLKNDAKLVEEGADMTPDGKITPTDDQIKDAKIEMGEHFYKEGQELKEDNRGLERKNRKLNGEIEGEREAARNRLKWQAEKHEKELERQRELMSKFQGNEEVNGFKIMVDWIEGENDIKGPGSIESGNYYEIYFPQIEDTSNQAINISAEDATAKEVFDYAMKLAETETDINELREKVDEYINTLAKKANSDEL